jgi:hypothetical protein
VATHHGHLPALGDGAAAAAHACLVPARPVHLLTSSLLPPVEEGLIHQEAAPQRGLQELGASCRDVGEAVSKAEPGTQTLGGEEWGGMPVLRTKSSMDPSENPPPPLLASPGAQDIDSTIPQKPTTPSVAKVPLS